MRMRMKQEAGERKARKGSDSEQNAQEEWQITIVIKMAIWMIKGSLELQEWRNGRKRGGRGRHLMSGQLEKSAVERTD